MGGKEIEFEVERRREERLPLVKGEEAKRESKGKTQHSSKEQETTEAEDDDTWQSYFENQKTMDNMKFFIIAQSFVMFLTFGLPQMQKAFAIMQDMFFS